MVSYIVHSLTFYVQLKLASTELGTAQLQLVIFSFKIIVRVIQREVAKFLLHGMYRSYLGRIYFKMVPLNNILINVAQCTPQ